MPPDEPVDIEIARLYREGRNTREIARTLGLSQVEVIGRVRALALERSGTAAGRGGTVGTAPPDRLPSSPPHSESKPDADVVRPSPPGPREAITIPGRRKDSERAHRRQAHAEQVGDDEQDDESLVQLPGRPRGWLITEAEFSDLFLRKGGRYEDVPRKRPRHGSPSKKVADSGRSGRSASIFDRDPKPN